MKYENRVVAFIDILGFKNMLDETVNKKDEDLEENIDKLIAAYNEINELWKEDRNDNSKLNSSRKVTIFSDSIVVSFQVSEPSQVFKTLVDIKHLVMSLVNREILCRGAISVGKLIHTDEYIFGPALVEAYTLESKAALYPRIILDREIVKIGAENRNQVNDYFEEQNSLEMLLEKDSDGMYYIDYFFKAAMELDDVATDFPHYIETLGNIIRSGLKASSHSSKSSVRIKFLWMRERYNHMVKVVKGSISLENTRKDVNEDLVEFYSTLKPISPERFKHSNKGLGVSK
jgi:hypothetical protein